MGIYTYDKDKQTPKTQRRGQRVLVMISIMAERMLISQRTMAAKIEAENAATM